MTDPVAFAAAPEGQPVGRVIDMPADTNPEGDIFGGWLLAHMDLAGATPAFERADGRCATVALDAFHDSGHPEHLAAAQQALSELAQHPALDNAARREAIILTAELDATGQPTAAYGVAALTLARRLGQQTALR